MRDEAVRVARRLQQFGFEALFAGGCVRDRLLGIEPREFDIATSATPEEVKRVFPRAIGVGESFGVMLLRSGGATFEIATFRTDGGYLDGRHPTEVRFAGAEEDARRRDFTINGLFERPESGEVVDFVGGRGDLEARLLRAIGDPAARLAEDRLRALRAVRFAARFELSVDPATETAILALDGDLFGVSRERLGQELRRMFFERHRSRAASLLERWGLDRVLLGARGDSEEQRRLASLPADASPMTSLAAWLLDRGESTDPIAVAERLQGGLGLSNAEREELAAVLRSVESLRHEWGRAGIARRRRLGMEPGFDPAVAIREAEDPGEGQAAIAFLAEYGPDRSPERLVRGRDLIEAGFVPGRRFGDLLEAAYDAQLEGRLHSRDEALAFVRDLDQGTDLPTNR
ncbi:MAG: CCA tRNA nucleotidyltransferase [Phycisphaerales bacterium]